MMINWKWIFITARLMIQLLKLKIKVVIFHLQAALKGKTPSPPIGQVPSLQNVFIHLHVQTNTPVTRL